MVRYIVISLMAVSLAACTTTSGSYEAGEEAAKPGRSSIMMRDKYEPKLVQHIKGSAFGPTERGYYTAELVIKPKPPIVGNNSAHVIIHNWKAQDIPGLDITIEPFLPDKDLQPDQQPKVMDAGRGLYVVHDIYLTEPGFWKVKVTIAGPKMTDTVVLDLPEAK